MKLDSLVGNPARWVRKHLPFRHHYERPKRSFSREAGTAQAFQMEHHYGHPYMCQRDSFDSQGSRTSFPGNSVRAIGTMPSIASLGHANNDHHHYNDSPPEPEDIYGGSRRSTLQEPRWDIFRLTNEDETRDDHEKFYALVMKVFKFVAYIFTFILVLVSAVISKGIVLFMTSQIRVGRATPYCKVPNNSPEKRYEAVLNLEEQAQWIWAIFFTFMTPECFALLRSLRILIFKSTKQAQKGDFFMVVLFETLHTVGVAMLLFVALPELDAVKGAMLTNCVCIVPAILALLSRHKQEEKRVPKTIIDVLAILAQATGLFVWPIALSGSLTYGTWAIPAGVFLTSFGWWENYVDIRSPWRAIQVLAQIKERVRHSRYCIYAFVPIWKVLVFFASMIGFLCLTSTQHNMDRFPFFEYFFELSSRSLEVKTMNMTTRSFVASHLDGSTSLLASQLMNTDLETDSVQVVPSAALVTWTIQFLCAGLCYIVGKFSCRICIQGFSFAFPVNLTIPVTISLLIAACGMKSSNVCFLKDVIPRYLYWVCPTDDFFTTFVSHEQAWIWLLWLLSQTWITLHIWTPKCERLASTEKLFVVPMYSGIFLDQSLGMNRRRDEEDEVKTKDLETDSNQDDGSPCYESISEPATDAHFPGPDTAGVKPVDQITHIYACATMWHETDEEMIAMLKSVIRMDEDQSARRNAQKYLQIVDPDYYEYETHIFFDDAFEMSDEDETENVVNRFVKSLVKVILEAACKVHEVNHIPLKPPIKVPTPYGGRLVWTLPGKTLMYAHLKDKGKIRHRKRWSQVMYMYYLLGLRLMDTDMDTARKEALASNTYLLTLDGDIDFKPSAVQLLVDLMKKNRNLGAACGRIHPIGTGMMVWYQKFEYAIGHWLQKATEHMIGCVLCSPGCFSLFRAQALMDDNVMKRYTLKSNEALHYVQYDQGEDRWLCTLLLQRGYRVEYSAASDAYTHCPEGFNEFYNQRRRWVPSTMANIMDLLGDAGKTVKVNDNISTLYIIYQGMLMVGTILGPGTIFLMLVGAFVAAFRIDNWTSFYANIIPILLFFIICFLAKSEHQLVVAQMLSAGYALVMMAVLVGISLQMREDGIGSPSFIFFVLLTGSFLISAILHPQEFSCIIPGLIYYLSIPSMYLLLIIYSLVNLNNVTWGTREVQTKKTKELLFAQFLTCIYALVMMAVLVGIILEIKYEGWFAPTTAFTMFLVISMVATALLHPMEITCLFWGWLYWLLIPSMYLLLIIYSFLNMNNVTWGTREVAVKKGKEEVEREKKEEEERKKAAQGRSKVFNLLGVKEEDMEGGFSVNLANLCAFMCCTHPKPKDEQIQMLQIQTTLDKISRRIDYIERSMSSIVPGGLQRRRSTIRTRSRTASGGERNENLSVVEEGETEDDIDMFGTSEGSETSEELEQIPTRDPMVNPLWIEDKDLKGPMTHLSDHEITFWQMLVDKYLYPIDDDKDEKARISVELKELRNKAVFAFFMLNALFILIVFLLQLNKDSLYINWPLGAKTNITWNEETKTISITKEYLHLEPIGFVFVIFFGLIMVIQFLGMLFHRFGTLSHILASTDMNCCNRKAEEMTSEDFIQRHAVEIARQLQRLRDFEGEDNTSEDGSNSGRAVGRRKTIANLEKSMKKKQRVGTLDVAFRQRFFTFSADAAKVEGTPILNGMRKLSLRKETIAALAHRRSTVMQQGGSTTERMQTLGARNSVASNVNRHRPSQPRLSTVFPPPPPNGHANEAFEHSGDEEERMSRMSRRTSSAGEMDA